MNWIKKFLGDTVYDLCKDNMKAILTSSSILFVGWATSLFKNISSISVSIRMNYLLILASVFIVLIYILVNLYLKNKKVHAELEEYKNPSNDEVKNFSLGDIVILRTEKDSPCPQKMTVSKITKSEIHARKLNNLMTIYAPQELLTNSETLLVFHRLDEEKEDGMLKKQPFGVK